MSVDPTHMTVVRSFQNQGDNFKCRCDVCGKTLAKKSNLTRHFRKVHGIDPLPKNPKYKCECCERQFNNSNQLRYHQEREHMRLEENDKRRKTSLLPSQPTDIDLLQMLEDDNFKEEQTTRSSEVKRHECPLCNDSFCRPDFPSHFESKHKLTLQIETLEFDSFTDFMEWKVFMENETQSNYYKERTSKYGQMNYHYFICNRSGTYKAKNLSARYLRGQGTCKMNAYCPSSIRVQERKDGNCLVSYQTVHVGHTQNLNHCSAERQEIVTKISASMPVDYTLDNKHNDSFSENELNFQTEKEFSNNKIAYFSHFQSNEDVLYKTKDEHVEFSTRDEEMSDFTSEDSTDYTPYLKDENEKPDSSLYNRKENLIKEFTEIIENATLPEEFDVVEKTLVSLKAKFDAVRTATSVIHLNAEKTPVHESASFPMGKRN